MLGLKVALIMPLCYRRRSWNMQGAIVKHSAGHVGDATLRDMVARRMKVQGPRVAVFLDRLGRFFRSRTLSRHSHLESLCATACRPQ